MGEIKARMVMAMQVRNYSASTVKTYVSMLRCFVRFFSKSPSELGEAEVGQYLRSLVERKVSHATVRLTYSVLKFFYVEVLGRTWTLQRLPQARREKRLPVVLSGEEVRQLFDAAGNLKHRAVLMMCYSAGLRVGEAVQLKVTDIDSQRMQIRVEQGKGKKDRYTLLASGMLDTLRRYWKQYRPVEWLFAGRSGDRPMSVRMAQTAFARAKKKRVSSSPSRSTRSVTVLLPTCWSPVPTSF